MVFGYTRGIIHQSALLATQVGDWLRSATFRTLASPSANGGLPWYQRGKSLGVGAILSGVPVWVAMALAKRWT